jgi:hypothetical protein
METKKQNFTTTKKNQAELVMDEELKQRRLDIAKNILNEITLPTLNNAVKEEDITRSKEKSGGPRKRYRTLQIMSDPLHQNLYSMEIEREMMVNTKLKIVSETMLKLSKKNTNIRQLSLTLRNTLQVSI